LRCIAEEPWKRKRKIEKESAPLSSPEDTPILRPRTVKNFIAEEFIIIIIIIIVNLTHGCDYR